MPLPPVSPFASTLHAPDPSHLASCEACRAALSGTSDDAHGEAEIPADLQSLERYRIAARIGRGGMGEVYRAFDVRLGRDVALKVVRVATRAGEEVPAGSARLLREAQALAKVSHPHVIAVYDVGTVAGQVFVAMELVHGETLRAWLARERRPPRAVMSAFVDAGEGLAAAHAAGLVHRDFKPENVMVGRDGRVRVLDFGLARGASDGALDAAASGVVAAPFAPPTTTAGRTETGALVGTPRYMAPEQWLGRAVDARSDQYAFCVALHEALFDTHPLLGDDGGAPRIPRTHGRAVARLLARGLAADPDARYPTMAALLAELRPKTRRWTAAAAALAAAATAASVAWGVHARTERLSQCDASPESFAGTWDAARQARMEAAFTRALPGAGAAFFARFRGEVERYVGEWRAMHGEACRATRALHMQSPELMDLRMRCLDRRLDGLRGFVGRVEAASDPDVLLGAIEGASRLAPIAPCADAEQLARAVPLPADASARAEVVALERQVEEALGSRDRERSEQGLVTATRLEAEAATAGYAPLHARALLLLGLLQSDAGRTADAIRTFERAARVAGRGRDDRTVAEAWAQLAAAHASQSAYEKALTLEPVAQVAIERIGGAPEIEAPLERNIGWILRETERLDEASARYEALIGALAKDDGRLAIERSRAVNGLAVVRKEQGRYEEAQRLYEEAIALASAALGPSHPTVAVFQCNLGVTLQSQGKLDEARALFEAVRARIESVLGKDHPNRGLPLANLGTLHLESGALDEAEASFGEALRVWEKAYGPGELQVGQLRADLGRVSLKRGRVDEAIARLETAVACIAGSVGEASAHAADARAALADAYAAAGRTREARTEATRALADYRARGKEPHVLARIELTMADVLVRSGGDVREATSLAKEADARARAAGPDAKDTARRAEAWLAKHAARVGE